MKVVRIQRDRNRTGRMLSGSCTHVDQDTAEIQCLTDHGISEREKQYHDLRSACKSEISIWEQKILVYRLLCQYSREERKGDQEYIKNQLAEDYLADQINLKEYVDPFTGQPVEKG